MVVQRKILLAGILFAIVALFALHQTSAANGHEPGRVYQTYVVQKGDTLKSIARYFGVTPRAIRRANHLRSARIKPGERLKIPIKRGVVSSARSRCGATYQVQAADTLHTIARRCHVSVQQLRRLNHLDDAARLWVGQPLRIHGAGNKRNYLPAPVR